VRRKAIRCHQAGNDDRKIGKIPVNRSIASGLKKPQDYLLFGNTLRALSTKWIREIESMAENNELWYRNNLKDWATRMVRTYRRYASLWFAVRD